MRILVLLILLMPLPLPGAEENFWQLDCSYRIRFEFGPTGIYGAFARCNILSPGLRWEFTGTGKVSGFAGYRAVWLAAKRDALTTAGVREPAGNSGKFVGQQLEARLRINFNARLRAEVGAAEPARAGIGLGAGIKCPFGLCKNDCIKCP